MNVRVGNTIRVITMNACEGYQEQSAAIYRAAARWALGGNLANAVALQREAARISDAAMSRLNRLVGVDAIVEQRD